MTEFATLQHATYTEAEWTAWDGILLEGQMAYSSDVLYSGTDQMRHKVGNGTDTWTALDYVPEPSGFTGGSLTSAINEAKGSDIASASTTDIGAATGNFVHVTGTTTITALGTIQAGTRRIVRFAGALILTHNATSLILPTGANITTAANDVATFVSEGSGNWRCVSYTRANGQSLVPVTYGTTSNTACEGNDIRLKTNEELLLSYMGSGVINDNFDVMLITTSANMTSQRVLFPPPIDIREAKTITGAYWFQDVQGVYTASNYNGIGLYSYDKTTGTLTLVASSTDDGNIWKAAGSTPSFKAFSSSYSASPGIYFLGFLWCSSATTTAPALGVRVNLRAGVTSFDFPNSGKLSSFVNAVTALPSPTQAMSGTAASNTTTFWCGVY